MGTSDASIAGNGRGSAAWSGSWTHFSVDRRSSGYCRVAFDHPPTTATAVAELAELVDLIEADRDLRVVVFDYLAERDAERDAGTTAAWVDLLARLSRAPAVSIASIRGRADGVAREFVRACDLRFASRENALLGEVRVIADDELDAEVDRIASQLAHA
jgi:enoyl-CoA hydratase/carnithine racemase